MKNLFRLFVIGILACLCSCNSSKKNEQPQEEEDVNAFVNGLTAEDTTQVLNLATQYLEYMKNDQVDAALDMLSEVKNDTVIALSPELRNQLCTAAATFPVISYNIDVMFLRSETDNEVRYTTEFFEKPEGDNRPNTIKGSLYPCKVNGQWILASTKIGYNEEAKQLQEESVADEAE